MAGQSKLAQWLTKELDEEIDDKRAILITLCAISFFFVILAGCTANIALTIISVIIFFFLAYKSGMLQV